MEQYHHNEKFSSHQLEKFSRVFKNHPELIDEDPDQFVIHTTDENGKEKTINVIKREEIPLVIDHQRRHIIGIDIEHYIDAIIQYPNLTAKEALIKSGKGEIYKELGAK